MTYTQVSKTDIISIGTLPSTAKSYSYGTVTAPSALCPITYTFDVIDTSGVTDTSSLTSLVSLTPLGTSTSGTFVISVGSTSDTTLPANSPYVITVKAALVILPAISVTDTLTLTVVHCINLAYTPNTASDTLYIGGIPTVPKTYAWTNTLVSSPSTACPLTFSYKIVDSTGADRTTSLSSFITSNPVSSTPATFTIAVLASTDTTIASKSDYIVTVTAALAASPAVTKSDTLTLKIRNSCVNSISLANSVAYDWILKTGTKTFSYNMLGDFNTACPGETLTPSYSFTGLDSNIV